MLKNIFKKLIKPVLFISMFSLTFAAVPLIQNPPAAFAAAQNVFEQGGSTIDASTASQGYIRVKQSGVTARIKVQVIKDGKGYNYDLNNNGYFEAFPLQMGTGNYTVNIMQNTQADKYILVYAVSFQASFANDFEPFLHPSQFVNYNSESAAVKTAASLCSGKVSDVEKVQAVYNYITSNITYDKNTAALVQSGYIPNVDGTLNKKQGICFDYASLMAAMLRSQNIPTKVVVGVIAPNQIYHAWNEVYIKGVGWISVGISTNGSTWERMDSTFGSAKTDEMNQFILNPSNYTALKVY